MSKDLMITPLGHMLLTRKKDQLKKAILETQESLVDLTQGDSGDGFQDGFLLETQTNVQIMQNRLREIKAFLKDAVVTAEPEQKDTVSLGHRIVLTLAYPSGEHEWLTVVLTTTHELALLEQSLLDDEIPVSPNSALGKAIYGKKVGDDFSYEIEAGTVRGKLLKIEIWKYAFELPKFALL